MKLISIILLALSLSVSAKEPHPWENTAQTFNPILVCVSENAAENIWQIHKKDGQPAAERAGRAYAKEGICRWLRGTVFVAEVKDIAILDWTNTPDGSGKVGGHFMHIYANPQQQGWGLYFMFMRDYYGFYGESRQI